MRQSEMRSRSCGIRVPMTTALAVLFGPMALFAPRAAAQVAFVRADANQDGAISVTDAVCIRSYEFGTALAPRCLDTADVNDDGQIGPNAIDAITVLSALFYKGPPPAPPFPEPGFDPTPDCLECAFYEAYPPAHLTNDVIRVGDVAAMPGEEIVVPVYLTNSVNVDAIQLLLETDPPIFTPVLDADALDFTKTVIERYIDVPVWSGITEVEPGRMFAIGLCFGLSFWSVDVLPVSTREELLVKIRGRIAENPPGDAVIRPMNGPDGQGIGTYKYKNELCNSFQADAILPKNLIGGTLDVKGEFLRGDANGGGRLDLSDAVAILLHLFAGRYEITCADAADANDDETVDIADAIFIVQYLFAQGPALPAPHGACGLDPTPNPDPMGTNLAPCTYELRNCPQ